jgi:hypothetical protein
VTQGGTSGQQEPGRANIPPHVHSIVLYACVLILLGSAGSAVAYLFFPPGHVDVRQYHIAVALLCFALSTVSCLLLYGNVTFTAKWGDYALAVVGPASMWIFTLAAFNYIFPEKLPVITYSPAGETNYTDWLSELHSVAPLFRDGEDQSVPNLLGNLYYPGYDHTKPSDVTIDVLLAYMPDGESILIRRISGKNSSGKAEVFHRPLPTNRKTTVDSISFTRSFGKYATVKNVNDKIWNTAPSDVDLDWYDVTIYGERIETADFFAFDVPKFIDNTKQAATVNFALQSSRALEVTSVRAWEVKPSPVALEGQVPLLFKDTNELPDQNVTQVKNDLAQFVGWLDQATKSSDEEMVKFTSRLNEAIFSQLSVANRQLSILLNQSSLFPSALSFHLSNIKNSLIFTYQFK